MIQLRRFDQIQPFWDQAQDYLLQHQAEHNLLLGILHSLLHYPERYPEPAYLAIVEAQTNILAVAVRTPPYKLVLSQVQDLAALQLIAQDLYEQKQVLPGASGLVAAVEAFLQRWQPLTGQAYQLAMEMRIHQLTAVQPIVPTQGFLRTATASDRPLLLNWFTEFAAELSTVVGEAADRMVDNGLKRQSIYLWEDGVPVSFACGSQFLPAAARIGPVYIPPEYRRKGYATACVASLSQQLLNQGCHRCFLFTDLANPTSNHIYQTIGYRPVCDWHDYSFQ